MRGFDWVFLPLGVCILLLSLGSSPVKHVLTHAFGTLAAEVDHAERHR